MIQRKRGAVGGGRISVLLLSWLLFSGFVLGMVYHVDKAGWNWFKLTGYDTTLPEDHSELLDLTPQEWIKHFPMFSYDPKDDRLVLKKGEYEIDATIVVPGETLLKMEPGTNLRFHAGRSLISHSPIFAQGTEADPIVFTAQNKWLKWGAVGLVKTKKSVFDHVVFEYGRRASVNGIDFLAGLSLIESDVEIRNCRFLNMFGKDAVNVRFANALIKNNIFKNAYKDGVDCDGATGEISDNEFINCGDEGIDLSENFNIRVYNNKVLDERGGRIAAENDLREILSLNTLGYLHN
ncbi:hypothetical protein GWN42_05240 [candidate division KSB1 bacterium]|nr:hypothetical protein [candidate division KSB1 bacterium]